MRKFRGWLVFLSCFGAAGASADDAGRTVALLLAGPNVTSLSELAGKNIAIDEATAASHDEAQHRVEATVGAKFAGGRARALDRLVNGEVPAAVLTLDYPEAADWSAEIAGFKVFRIPLSDRPQAAEVAAANPAVPDAKPVVADAKPAEISPSPPPPAVQAENVVQVEIVDPAIVAATAKMRERIRVATVVAEHVMAMRNAEKKALSSSNGGEPSVAIVVAGPEIKSLSDLSGKIIAIDDRHLKLHTRLQAAFVVAGATDSLLTASDVKAEDRLLSGKVSAAVLTLVYPETGFSAIEGFSVFRVSLEHQAMKARM